MNRLFLSLALLSCLSLVPASCEPAFSSTAGSEQGSVTDNEGNEEENMSYKLNITVESRTFTATLVENSSAEALLEKLAATGPISIVMSDYGDMEKVGSLGFSLPRNDVQTTTGPGDIILYLGSNFVIYYDSNSWNFTKFGHVDGVSTRAEMLELLGGKGSKTVELSLPE